MLKADFDPSGLLKRLGAITAGVHEAVRPAAQAGAQELYEEAKLRCPVSAEAHVFYGKRRKDGGQGKYLFQPGTLRSSIYQAFSKDNSQQAGSGYGRATYHVAWNHQKAPYGYMVEYGTSRAPAHPFLRPAYDAKAAAALMAAERTFAARIKDKL